MALIRKAALPDMSGPIPQGIYTLAITKAEYKKSASGSESDMLVLELQIVAPANVQHEGQNVKTAGRKMTHRVVCTEKSNIWVKEFEQLLDGELPDEIDTKDLCVSAAAELSPGENGLKYLVGVELAPDPYFETDKATNKPVIGADGQKVIRGYSFKRVSKTWPKPCSKEVAEMAA